LHGYPGKKIPKSSGEIIYSALSLLKKWKNIFLKKQTNKQTKWKNMLNEKDQKTLGDMTTVVLDIWEM
jgi:hypothetical protein